MARLRSRYNLRWLAWAGILALALNALVPIHLAFDLGETPATTHHDERHGLEWRVIATLIGHDAGDADHDSNRSHHHDVACPVIAAFGALTGLVAATPPLLAQPIAVALATTPMPAVDRPVFTSTAVYRSRAPPLA